MSRLALTAAAGAAGGLDTDEFFENTTLLLHGDGTNGAQNNTFLDSSTNNFTITRNGNTTQGSFSPFSKPDGAWGNYFTDAGGDYFSLAADAALVPPTSSAFTVECWIYPTGSTANPIFNEVYSGGSNKVALAFNLGSAVANTSGLYPWIGFYNGSAWSGVISDVAVNANEWSHIACVFTGSAVEIYINGSAVATTGSISTWVSVVLGDGWRIGKSWTTGAELTGYLSNLRYVNGSAVYSSGFTPSGPLTAITNTVLLTCQSNRFVDNSSNSFALTVVGTPKVTPFSPFPLTTEYSGNSGSGYFDGSGDQLSAPVDAAFQPDTGDFSTSAWIYPVSTAIMSPWGARTGAGNNIGISINRNAAGGNSAGYISAAIRDGNVLTIAAGGIKPFVWQHLIFCKTGNLMAVFVDGVRKGSLTENLGTIPTQPFEIGDSGLSRWFHGHISDFEFVNGSRYDATQTTVTIPSAPITTPVANTSLLCNFTNAGIYDNTGFNVLETVGNAQVDTANVKYGTGSLEFDGTGDYLRIPDTESLEFGSGNFTVECWANLTALPGNAAIMQLVGKWDNSSQKSWFMYIYNNGGTYQLYFSYTTDGSTNVNPEGSISITTGVWYHFAVTRSGADLKLFLDGTQVGSTHNISTNSIFGGTYPIDIGGSGTGQWFLNGYIDELRITSGVARYTANFTPQVKIFPDIG